jgi:RNA polymerase sigma factor (sigma-70 family)
MSAPTRGQPAEAYQLQIYIQGRTYTVHIWAPARAFRSSRLASDEYRSQLISHAKRIIHDDAWAEDIVQSSLESAYRKLNNGQLYALHFFGGYLLIQDGTLPITAHRRRVYTQAIQLLFSNQEPEGLEVIEQPLAWLKKIVENNAKKMYNQQKKYREFCENPGNWLQAEDPRYPNPEKTYLQQEEYDTLHEIIAALPAQYPDIVNLRFFAREEYSFQDIATHLQRPVHTVTSQASRALDMIGETIKGERSIVNHRLTRKKRPA